MLNSLKRNEPLFAGENAWITLTTLSYINLAVYATSRFSNVFRVNLFDSSELLKGHRRRTDILRVADVLTKLKSYVRNL